MPITQIANGNLGGACRDAGLRSNAIASHDACPPSKAVRRAAITLSAPHGQILRHGPLAASPSKIDVTNVGGYAHFVGWQRLDMFQHAYQDETEGRALLNGSIWDYLGRFIDRRGI